MSAPRESEPQHTASPTGTTRLDEAPPELRRRHLARGRSAVDRAAAMCRYAGIAEDAAQVVPKDPAAKAANAVRLSAQALARLPEQPLDPAADARCARNAAAAAGGRDEALNRTADAAEAAAVAAAEAAGWM